MAGLSGSEVPIWDIDAKIGETDLLVHTVEQDQSLARTLGSLGWGTTTSTSQADGASRRQAAVCYRHSAAFLAHGGLNDYTASRKMEVDTSNASPTPAPTASL